MGLLYPFFGTLIGSSFVFFMKKAPSHRTMIFLDCLAAGVMCAASFFSLIAPACERAEEKGSLALLFCSTGFFSGMLIFILTDKLLRKLAHEKKDLSSGLLFWSVSIHNIPEGMAVGVVFAGLLSGGSVSELAGALSLSLGIALQNIPEGAIISMPLNAKGKSPVKAFLKGMYSGLAELIPAVLSLFVSVFVGSILPFSLCFAAGAMFFVVLRELSSEFSKDKHSGLALFVFSLGFTLMMLLDTLAG